jgi:S1-C subfamily serine protease
MLRPSWHPRPPPRTSEWSAPVFSRDVEGPDPSFFDDDRVPHPPLPPEDRLWRHPSEVNAVPRPAPPPRHRYRPILSATAVVALSGAALVLAFQVRTGSRSTTTGGAQADLGGSLLSVPTSVTSEVVPPDAVVMAQQITPRSPSVMVGATWRPAIVTDEGYLVVAEPAGTDEGDLVVALPDGTIVTVVRSVARVHPIGIALITIDDDVTPSNYRRGPIPAVGEMVVAEGRTGIVVAQRSSPRADGLLFEAAAVVKFEEVAVGDVVWQGELFVGMVVAVQGHYATVMPASLVMSAAASLTDQHELAWAGMGVQSSPAGVTVAELTPDGPADRAGLRTGDVLHSIDGHPLTHADDVLVWLWQCGAYRDAVVTIERDAEASDITVTLAAVPADA